uniref:Uncharacterized protein n=1 Tax=Alexandrium monilatum TaxID=311494 RepID=A0A7S4Q182_9DINO
MSDQRYLRLAKLHDACFHFLSDRLDVEFDGLHSAVRAAQRRGLLAAPTVKCMMRLDHAFHVCRHLTQSKANGIFGWLCTEVQSEHPAADGPDVGVDLRPGLDAEPPWV